MSRAQDVETTAGDGVFSSPTLPVHLEDDGNVLEVLRDPGRVSIDGTSGTIPSLVPAAE